MTLHTPPRNARTPVASELAHFRYRLRLFLRFSERAARDAGVTPLQHQLILGAAGFTGRGWATISELAECLQMRHNAVVALVGRAGRAGLVRKRRSTGDRRVVRVEVTARGRRILNALTRPHQRELARFRGHLPSMLIPGRRAPRQRRVPR
ncbi:MAG: MarR family winged helix-turn-helix transcriptional regulator [Gemmatimonadales bacterium]